MLEKKSMLTAIKNVFERFISGHDTAERGISKLKHSLIQIFQMKAHKEELKLHY